MDAITTHHHKRKRKERGLPARQSPVVRFIDVAIYPVAFTSLVMTLPQVYEVWVLTDVSGVSIITWSAWAVISLFWVAYGYVHKNNLLLYLHTGAFLIQSSVAIGVWLHI